MTVYVIENYPLMCEAVVFLLCKIDPSKKVIGVHDYRKLQETILKNGQPEIFVIDPLLMGINGLTAIKQINTNYPEAPLIIFSQSAHPEAQDYWLNAGADLYIEKTNSSQEIFNSIRNYLSWKKKTSKFCISKALSTNGLIKLSKRQNQLTPLIYEGLTNEEIAKRLDISAHTVKVHLWRFYKKLGISSRTQLSKFARDNGYM